ncbi:MAG: response regulator [Gammaproteobacteria bacterium]
MMGSVQRNLLLVDDEENILSALTRVLRRDGYTILRATGGAAGLELLANHPVGVIISDQRMPEMTGVEFLSHAKALYPDTVRIVLSGYTDLNSVADSVNRGAIFKFLTKPWEDEQLSAQVREAFQYYEMKQENVRLTAQLQTVNEALAVLNQTLEKRVEEQTRSLRLNVHALRISQAVLEDMPLAVLGVGDDGVIAVANQAAHELLAAPGTGLVGQAVATVLPDVVVQRCLSGVGGAPAALEFSLAGQPPLLASFARLDKGNSAAGTVVVLRPR